MLNRSTSVVSKVQQASSTNIYTYSRSGLNVIDMVSKIHTRTARPKIAVSLGLHCTQVNEGVIYGGELSTQTSSLSQNLKRLVKLSITTW